MWRGDSLSKANPGPVVADLDRVRPGCSIHPARGAPPPGSAPGSSRRVGGPERVARQDVLDVHQQQLLVLLLVVEAQLDQVRAVAGSSAVAEQRGHGPVDVAAVVGHLGHARAGDDSPRSARGCRAPTAS